jgi:hypothetical protein
MTFSRITADFHKQMKTFKDKRAAQQRALNQRALQQRALQTRKLKQAPKNQAFQKMVDKNQEEAQLQEAQNQANLYNNMPIAPTHDINLNLQKPISKSRERRNAVSRIFKGDWLSNIKNRMNTTKKYNARANEWNRAREYSRMANELPPTPTGPIMLPQTTVDANNKFQNEFDNVEDGAHDFDNVQSRVDWLQRK